MSLRERFAAENDEASESFIDWNVLDRKYALRFADYTSSVKFQLSLEIRNFLVEEYGDYSENDMPFGPREAEIVDRLHPDGKKMSDGYKRRILIRLVRVAADDGKTGLKFVRELDAVDGYPQALFHFGEEFHITLNTSFVL